MNISLEACIGLLTEGTYKEDTEFIIGNYIAVDMDSRTADDIMRGLWKTPSNWFAKSDNGYNSAGMVIYNKINDEYVASIISDNGDIKKHVNKNYTRESDVNKMLKKCEERLNKEVKYSRTVARHKRNEKATAVTALTIAALRTAAAISSNNDSYSHRSSYSTSYNGNRSTTTYRY